LWPGLASPQPLFTTFSNAYLYERLWCCLQDPSDPFNQFWTILQGMLENFSAPVAWATVPLNGEAPRAAVVSNPDAITREVLDEAPDDSESETFSEDEADEFYLVMPEPSSRGSTLPNGTGAHSSSHSYPPARSRTQEELYYENVALKQNMDVLAQELEDVKTALKRKEVAERENVRRLQGSILDVRQRMHASVLGVGVNAGAGAASPRAGERDLRPSDRTGSASPRLPPSLLGRGDAAGASGAKEAEEQRAKEKAMAEKEEKEKEKEKKRAEELEGLRKKVKDAEEETMRLRIENERTKADLKKYRERWEKVKESAKKKKEAKEAAAAGAGAGAGIAVVGGGAAAGIPGAGASASGV